VESKVEPANGGLELASMLTHKDDVVVGGFAHEKADLGDHSLRGRRDKRRLAHFAGRGERKVAGAHLLPGRQRVVSGLVPAIAEGSVDEVIAWAHAELQIGGLDGAGDLAVDLLPSALRLGGVGGCGGVSV
jgi:hypothetical protein